MEPDWDGGVGAWGAVSPPQRDSGSLSPPPGDDAARDPPNGLIALPAAASRPAGGVGREQEAAAAEQVPRRWRSRRGGPTRETADRNAFWRLISDDEAAISAEQYCSAHVLMQHAWSPRTFSPAGAARLAAADWIADARGASSLSRDRCLRRDSALLAQGFAVHKGSFPRILRKVAVRRRHERRRRRQRREPAVRASGKWGWWSEGSPGAAQSLTPRLQTWDRLRTHDEIDAAYAPPPPPPPPPSSPPASDEESDVRAAVELQRFSPIAIKPAPIAIQHTPCDTPRLPMLRKPSQRMDHDHERSRNDAHDRARPPLALPRPLLAASAIPRLAPVPLPRKRLFDRPVRAATSPSIPASARSVPIAPEVMPSPRRSPRLSAPVRVRCLRSVETDRSGGNDRQRRGPLHRDRDRNRDHTRTCGRDHCHAPTPGPKQGAARPAEPGPFAPEGWVVRGSAKEGHVRGRMHDAPFAESPFIPSSSVARSPRARRVQWWKQRSVPVIR